MPFLWEGMGQSCGPRMCVPFSTLLSFGTPHTTVPWFLENLAASCLRSGAGSAPARSDVVEATAEAPQAFWSKVLCLMSGNQVGAHCHGVGAAVQHSPNVHLRG